MVLEICDLGTLVFFFFFFFLFYFILLLLLFFSFEGGKGVVILFVSLFIFLVFCYFVLFWLERVGKFWKAVLYDLN